MNGSVCLSVYPSTQTRQCLRAEGVLMYRLFGESWSKNRAKYLCQNALLQVRSTGPSPAGTHSCKKKNKKKNPCNWRKKRVGVGSGEVITTERCFFFPQNAQLAQFSQSNTPESIKPMYDHAYLRVFSRSGVCLTTVCVTYRDCNAWRFLRAALGTIFSWLFWSMLGRRKEKTARHYFVLFSKKDSAVVILQCSTVYKMASAVKSQWWMEAWMLEAVAWCCATSILKNMLCAKVD